MTCIVGWIQDGDVYIGGDSACSSGYDKKIQAGNNTKVFQNGEMIFGSAGSIRLRQILEYSLVIPHHPVEKDTYQYLCTDFIDAVRICLKNKGHTKVKDNEETQNGLFLLGYRRSLYRISYDFQVVELVWNYSAVGCAEDYALGALYVLNKYAMDKTPEEKLTEALEVASTFSAYVSPPFKIIKLEKKEQ